MKTIFTAFLKKMILFYYIEDKRKYVCIKKEQNLSALNENDKAGMTY